ncbi:unnamed protein product [Rotaria socialis]|uniref:Uncharacterized protein n=1 Tax=Rotaria socialis TaxID=392032 RepID=A0A820VWG9_9BILA|nr:unnamed protein product [Rotaria socialis]CAF4416613.1 unnamed protein product [Rotaria socialis]CAF4506079.1 unnamed protein product [Rotaria socialis]CAF4740526.1 unnamed protein product [Rotaria socialis]CAF4914894.1 unnamed protein product [Rotaria socialis]
MENESAVVRLRRKLSELSDEYSKEKQAQPRSKSANSRVLAADPNASFRYRRMRRKVDVLRTQMDAVMHDNYLSKADIKNSQQDMIPTRDGVDLILKKKLIIHDDQNLVTSELVQVLNSKQTRINELEQRLKQAEQQESQWKTKYERESNRCEVLQTRIIELEQELLNRKHQSKILGQLKTDVKRLHSAFDALEVENTQLNVQLSLARNPHLSSQLDKFRNGNYRI